MKMQDSQKMFFFANQFENFSPLENYRKKIFQPTDVTAKVFQPLSIVLLFIRF